MLNNVIQASQAMSLVAAQLSPRPGHSLALHRSQAVRDYQGQSMVVIANETKIGGFGYGTGTLTGEGTVWPWYGGGLLSFVSSGTVSGAGSFIGCGTIVSDL